jgi:KaiC/GvpD/RAD55 family RecA-like ATPase
MSIGGSKFNHEDWIIPGQNYIIGESKDFPQCVMLLIGPSGSGKTAYALQFLRDGIMVEDYCLFVNCGQAFSLQKFQSYFTNKKSQTIGQVPRFLDLFSIQKNSSNNEEILWKLQRLIMTSLLSSNQSITQRLVVDSLNSLIARFSEEAVQKFVAGLYDFLKTKDNITALFIAAGIPSTPIVDILGSLVDGIIQLKIEDSDEEIKRHVRILSLKTVPTVPKWIPFKIKEDGRLHFGQNDLTSKTGLYCKLCHELIIGPIASTESESPFHPYCFDTYRKLGDIYGSNILYSLQPGVVNANFFFIDIVGLSDPLLSVEKQIRKIEDLNSLIASCDAFTKVARDNKIVLPTGDGMVIGFLMNPELPLQLSIQLHRKLQVFNARNAVDRTIGVRIGLSSGPVFVVTDINNNQNVWGPGIILARRVMDLGDSGHILLADNIAETLMNLKDEYKETIRPISTAYKIKHGQLLRLYSAYSRDFGNPTIPARILEMG